MGTVTFDKNILNSIEKKELLRLSKLNSLVSLGSLFFEWALIFGAIYFCEAYWHPALYVFCLIFIAARMHAIATLAHDAVHYLFLKNKKWNDKITEFFITWPLFFSFKKYRKSHLAHHQYLNTDKDPDLKRQQEYKEFQFPLRKLEMLWIIIKDVLGINFIIYRFNMFITKKNINTLNNKLDWFQIIYYLSAFFILIQLDLSTIFLKYWLIPYITWLQFILRVRAIAEHYALPKNTNLATRTTLTSLIDWFFFGPKNTNYHAEHHIFPSVPFFNLPKLHKSLMMSNEFKKSVHITKGYFSVINECLI